MSLWKRKPLTEADKINSPILDHATRIIPTAEMSLGEEVHFYQKTILSYVEVFDQLTGKTETFGLQIDAEGNLKVDRSRPFYTGG